MPKKLKDEEAPVEEAAPETSMSEQVLTKLVERMEAMQPVKRGHSRRDWPPRVIPEKVSPGYAIVSDDRGQSPKLVPLYMVMNHASRVRPVESGFGGKPVETGGLFDKITSRQVIVQQFAKYPAGHVTKGNGKYFDYSGYREVDGVFYHPNYIPKGHREE